MIKRILFYSLSILLLFTLQETVFRSANFFGSVPLCMLILVVSIAMMRGAIDGAIIGVAAGMLSGAIYALIFMYIGLGVGILCRDFFQHRRAVVLLFVLAAEIVFDLLYYFFMFLIWGQTDFLHMFARIMLPEMAYTAVVAIPLYVLLERINGWIAK